MFIVYEAGPGAFDYVQHGKLEKGFCGKHQAQCRMVKGQRAAAASSF